MILVEDQIGTSCSLYQTKAARDRKVLRMEEERVVEVMPEEV